MRVVLRLAAVALLALITSLLLAVTSTLTSVALAATALIMGGTGHPLSRPQDTQAFIQNYVTGANGYIAPSGLCAGGSPGCTLLAVYAPNQFRFDTGLFDMTFDQSIEKGRQNLDNCIRGVACTVTPGPYAVTPPPQTLTDSVYAVYGYSQSAAVATLQKRDLIANPQPLTEVFFVLAANPNKPNGGILERFKGLYIPIVGVTFNGATPTNSDPFDPMLTVDLTRQYDGWADFPTNPLNLIADLNAAMGIAFLHGNYDGVGTPEAQGQYGDTTYYMIPTPVLPLLMPFDAIPLIGHPLAATLDPFFRVLVEAGYDRTINPGQPTTAKWLYIPNPISTLINLVAAIPTGLDNLISTITNNPLNRPFGTQPPGPYGVGGPDVDRGCGTPPCGPPTPALTAPLPSMSTLSVQELDAPQSPAHERKSSRDEVSTADTSLADTPKDPPPLTGNTGDANGQQTTKPADEAQLTAVENPLTATPSTGNADTQTTKPGDEDQLTATAPTGSGTRSQTTKPAEKPAIVKLDAFTVPQPAKKADQPDARKPAAPKLPRIRDVIPSLADPSRTPKPAADADATPAGSPSDTAATT
ncbi:MAG: PE-PPE domain-containing protein, partial [Mycobacterium sp.]